MAPGVTAIALFAASRRGDPAGRRHPLPQNQTVLKRSEGAGGTREDYDRCGDHAPGSQLPPAQSPDRNGDLLPFTGRDRERAAARARRLAEPQLHGVAACAGTPGAAQPHGDRVAAALGAPCGSDANDSGWPNLHACQEPSRAQPSPTPLRSNALHGRGAAGEPAARGRRDTAGSPRSSRSARMKTCWRTSPSHPTISRPYFPVAESRNFYG